MSLCTAAGYRQGMTVDPRAALDRFVAALEAHYDAVVSRRGDDDPRVDDTYYVLGDAFEVYDDALGEAHGEATPFVLDDDDDDDDEDDEHDQDDDEHDDDEHDDHDDDDRTGLSSVDLDVADVDGDDLESDDLEIFDTRGGR
ncbi:hypothetical protein CLV28_1869 [Sediminihabitans luteus]|uniref:Primosomal protein n=2 Tax=Sediminihabitans luteus TaxID=1138585 RepID=A0A2M9CR27_9CELL|nr:hypothetical protein CLV28_1869 [Sediminihabitans luteus]